MPLPFATPAGAQSDRYGAGIYTIQTYSSTIHRTPDGSTAATAPEQPVWRSDPEGLSRWRTVPPGHRGRTTSGVPTGPGYTDYSGYYGAYTRPRAELEAEAAAREAAAREAATDPSTAATTGTSDAESQ